MQRVAQDVLVLHLGGGGTGLGVAVALQFAPSAVFGVHAGVWVDRLADRRRAMAGERAVAAVLALLFGVVAWGGGGLWLVYLVTVAFGLCTVISNPLQQKLLAELVDGPARASAVALNSAAFTTGRIAGSALGGLVIAAFGVAVTCAVNAATFTGVIGALAAMRGAELLPVASVGRAPGQARAGLVVIRRRRDLLLVMVASLIASVWVMPYQSVIVPLLVMEVYGGGARELGIAGAVIAVGAVVGQVEAGRHSSPRARDVAIRVGVAGALAVAFAGPELFLPVLAVASLPAYGWSVRAQAYLHQTVDQVVIGRVMAVWFTAASGANTLGPPLVGAIAGSVGARAALGICGAGAAVAIIILTLLVRPATGDPPPRTHPRP